MKFGDFGKDYRPKEKKVVKIKEVSVAEIHEEIDEACVAFLNQISEILKEEDEKDLEHASELKRLGFWATPNVKKYNQLIADKEEAERARAAYLRYNISYPEKFITEKMVEAICKKYGLLLGDTGHFVGEIPKKNVEELIEFSKRVKSDDLISEDTHFAMASTTFTHWRDASAGFSEYDPPVRMEVKKRNVKPRFMVIGTRDQFSGFREAEVVSGYRIREKDPVILCQVIGGYLIVTKWGAEAKVQDFHNEQEN